MRRTALIAAALLASHSTAVWLGHHSPASGAATTAATPSPVKLRSAGGSDLAAFLRNAKQSEEATEEPDGNDELQDEDALLAAAKAAIPVDADVAAIVKAATADQDLDVSIETRAAFGLWADRDPVVALRWLVGWERDAKDPDGLRNEFIRHFREEGVTRLAFYLRELPAAGSFLLSEVASSSFFDSDNEAGPSAASAAVLQTAAMLDSPGDRLALLSRHFEDLERSASHLAAIRALLDEHGAAVFLNLMSKSGLGPESQDELEHAGFPSYAVRQFIADHAAWSRPGQTRTNADFIGTVANTSIPGVPAATGTNVTDIVTAGLRSGDGAINRNNIDAVLNNPNRTAAPSVPLADQIRETFRSDDANSWIWFSGSGLYALPAYADGREDFLRGKITGEEWVARLQEGIPGAGDLHEELTAMAFRMSVQEDPGRALGLLQESQPQQGMLMQVGAATPELTIAMAQRFAGGGELSEPAKETLEQRAYDWALRDPGAYSDFVGALPAGPLKEDLAHLPGRGALPKE